MRVNADKELPLRTPECLDQLLVYVPSLKVTAENRVGEVLLDKVTGSSSIMAIQHHVELDLVLIGARVVSEREGERESEREGERERKREREREVREIKVMMLCILYEKGKTFFRQRNSAKSFSKVHCTCIS